MTEIISVKFKNRGKAYFFDPNGLKVSAGDQVVVETAKGLELADCVRGNHFVTDESIIPPLRPAIRLATRDDLRIAELCRQREQEAFGICEKKIAQHGLEMKLVDVECSFEGNKIMFFFTADGRVDFRALVKDLAGVFRTRIELRQIGVRDEAKLMGGLGMCGRPFCCHQFLDEFFPVSTKMAKTQSLSLNPTKISGVCGRLMCCLRYEQDAYEELVKASPKNGAFVETADGYGSVAQVSLLRRQVKVKLDEGDETPKTYNVDDVAVIPGGRPRAGEPLPHLLTVKPKAQPVPEDDSPSWEAPDLFGDYEEPAAAEPELQPVIYTGEPDGDKVYIKTDRRHKSRKKKSANSSGDSSGKGQAQEQAKPLPAEVKKAEDSRPRQGKRQPVKAGQNEVREKRGDKTGDKANVIRPHTERAAQAETAHGHDEAVRKKKNNYRRRYYNNRRNKSDDG